METDVNETQHETDLDALKIDKKELARREAYVHRMRVFVSDQQEALEHAKDLVREQIRKVNESLDSTRRTP